MITYLVPLSEFLCFYVVQKKLLEKSFSPQLTDFIFLLLNILVMTSIPEGASLLLLWILGQIFYFSYCIVTKHENFYHGLLLYCLCTSLLVSVELIVGGCFTVFSSYILRNYSGLLGNFLTLLFAFILLRYTPLKKCYVKLIDTPFPIRFVFLNTFCIISCIAFAWKLKPALAYNTALYVVYVILFLFAVNTSLFYYDKLNVIQSKELDSYKKNLPIYESLIAEIRSQQHEYTNRLQALQNLDLFCTDYDSLRKALKDNTQTPNNISHIYPLLQINMPLLAASLYSQYLKADAQNIKISFDIRSTRLKSSLNEAELTDLVTILVQNAIEASQPEDTLYASLSSYEGKTNFEIRNPVDHYYSTTDMRMFWQKGFSTKQNKNTNSKNKGLGLYYLHQCILKHNGYFFADCQEFNHSYWILFSIEI